MRFRSSFVGLEALEQYKEDTVFRNCIVLFLCATVLSIGTAATLSRIKPKPIAHADAVQQALPEPSAAASPVIPAPPAVPTLTPAVVPSPVAAVQSLAIPENYQAIQIDACNDQVGNANFRQFPDLAPTSILGFVPRGGTVFLTGSTAVTGGIAWVEAINPEPLQPHPAAGAQNQLASNQLGWIASCFIERL